MMTIRAIYENGVFRPTEPVNLPERAEVEVLLPSRPSDDEKLDAIYRIIGESYEPGETDVAERHNEHQP
jgi:predicted DNA-binding antitoxin AbrB/MazE fold protein